MKPFWGTDRDSWQ